MLDYPKVNKKHILPVGELLPRNGWLLLWTECRRIVAGIRPTFLLSIEEEKRVLIYRYICIFIYFIQY